MTAPVDALGSDPVGLGGLTVEDVRATLDELDVCIWSLEIRTGHITISPACERLFGVPAERLTTLADFDALVHPEDREIRQQTLQQAADQGGRYVVDFRVVSPDGQIRWLRSCGQVQPGLDGRPFRLRGIILGIGEQKQAEADLRTCEAHFHSILDTVPEAMIIIDEAGFINAFSPAAERVFGYAVGDVLGQNVRILMPEPMREAHDGYLAAYRRTGTRRIIGSPRVVTGRRRDGSTFPLELSVGEMRSGDRVFFTSFLSERTESMRTEARLQRLQAELVQVSRLSAMGEMASTLAHELNQPLGAISNYTRGCRRLLAKADEQAIARSQEALDRIAEQALRAGQIIRRLREFATSGETDRRLESVAQLIEEARALALIGARRHGLVFKVTLDPKVRAVMADRVLVHQVLVNLMRNAREAMRRSPRRELTVAVRMLPGDMVEIAVSDTGPGIADAIADRLFQPFVTTKPRGMGVGLSICRTIVETHGGHLTAERNAAGGATFRLTLQAAHQGEVNHGG